jgi:hypothetical protein
MSKETRAPTPTAIKALEDRPARMRCTCAPVYGYDGLDYTVDGDCPQHGITADAASPDVSRERPF